MSSCCASVDAYFNLINTMLFVLYCSSLVGSNNVGFYRHFVKIHKRMHMVKINTIANKIKEVESS